MISSPLSPWGRGERGPERATGDLMTNTIEQLVSEAAELTGADPPDLLADDAPVLAPSTQTGPLYLVGLIGGKDVGKSSLVNAIVGSEITQRTSHGPGTEIAIAYAHESAAGELRALLEREVPERFIIHTHRIVALSRQVLLDLPDIDSVYAEHIEVTRRMLRHMLYPIWVQSVEKYADQQPQKLLARVAEGNDPANFLFCLNKVDQLVAREGIEAVGELREDYARRVGRLLKQAQPNVYLVSAVRPGDFDLPALRELLSQQKAEKVEIPRPNRAHEIHVG